MMILIMPPCRSNGKNGFKQWFENRILKCVGRWKRVLFKKWFEIRL